MAIRRVKAQTWHSSQETSHSKGNHTWDRVSSTYVHLLRAVKDKHIMEVIQHILQVVTKYMTMEVEAFLPHRHLLLLGALVKHMDSIIPKSMSCQAPIRVRCL
jgi:hypothetical protein